MKLEELLGFRRGFDVLAHEALLNLYYTGDLIKKRARDFFAAYGITDVQFNLMILLSRQADAGEGLTQAELSRMMLVNRSNITTLIDRMEKAGLVMRDEVPGDRRFNAIRLTPHGRKILNNVEDKYMREVTKIMGALKKGELQELIQMLGRIREDLV